MTYQFEGIEWEETGEYRPVKFDEVALQELGYNRGKPCRYERGYDAPRKILRPVSQKTEPKVYNTLNAISNTYDQFQETGETRPPKVGEYYMEKEGVTIHLATIEPMPSRRIVRRIMSANVTQEMAVEATLARKAAELELASPAAFYQHVWGFPAPFEVGVKPNIARAPEPCPCCKGLREFSRTDHVPNGILHYKEVCPECLGTGTA